MFSWGFLIAESGYFLHPFPALSFKPLGCCFIQGLKLMPALRDESLFCLGSKRACKAGQVSLFAWPSFVGQVWKRQFKRCTSPPASGFPMPWE